MTNSFKPERSLRSGWHRAVIAVLLAIGFFAVLCIVFLSHNMSQEFRNISTAAELRERTGNVLANLLDMGISERVYMVTHKDSDIKRIMDSSKEIDTSLTALQAIVNNNPKWQNWFKSVNTQIKIARDNITYRVNTAKTNPERVTGKIIDMSGQELPSTENLRELMNIFSSNGDSFFSQGLRLERTRLAIIISAFVVLVAAFALGYLLISNFRREVRELIKHRDSLNKENELLGQRVLERTSELEAARRYAEKERARVELLLQDTSHRIGNSLAMVSSLLNLQSNRTDNKQVRAALISARDRILTISSAHRRLRLNDDMETSEVRDFLTSVVNDVKSGMMGERYRHINIITDFATCYVASRDVTTLGIILGELLTNAIKHAFPDRQDGLVRAFFGVDADGRLELVVEDNGVGMKQTDANEKTGLGQIVVRQLCKQFGEEPLFESAPGGGTRVVVYLPEMKLIETTED